MVFVLCALFQLSTDERCTPCELGVGLPGGGASTLRSRYMYALCTYLSFRKQCFIFVCYTFVICMSSGRSLQESSLLRFQQPTGYPMIEADEVTRNIMSKPKLVDVRCNPGRTTIATVLFDVRF